MKGQTGYERYYSALGLLRNGWVLPQGPVEKRGGFQYIADAQSSNAGDTRLFEFIASEDDAMIVEIDTSKIRFFKSGAQIMSGGSPYELSSWFSNSTELFEAHYTQEGNTLYIVHPNHYPRRLTRVADDDWQLTNIPTITEPYVEDYINPAASLTLSATTGHGVTATAGSSVFLAGEIGRFIRYNGGYGVITGYTSGTVVTISILSDFSTTSISSGDWELYGGRMLPGSTAFTLAGDPIFGATGTLTATTAVFRSGDVGKYIAIAGGVVRITDFTSSTVVSILLVTDLDNKTSTETWVLNKKAWVAAGDYPATVAFHESRLVLAGASDTSSNKNRIFASQSNDFTRFDQDADDNAGLSATLGGRANQIRWIESARTLQIGTVGDERDLYAANNGPLTPSTLASRTRTRWGSSKIKPVISNNEVIFSQRSRKNVRNTVFSFQEDTYNSEELSFHAQHISADKVKEMALQDDPRTVVWMPLDTGKLAGMSYKPEENILGWHLHHAEYTNGSTTYQAIVESVAVIPGSDGDEIWASIRYQTGASTYQKYIERINDDSRKAYLDSWVKFTAVSTSTTVTGLDHLEGMTVSVVNNGAVEPSKVVSSGSITLANAPAVDDVIYVGLPYTMTMEILEPEGGIGNGNSQGIQKRLAKCMVRVYDSGAFKINGTKVPFRDATMSMGSAPSHKTGDVNSDSGTTWDEKSKLKIESDLPLPLTVVMVAFHLDTSMKQ